jgi:hypothetical protein
MNLFHSLLLTIFTLLICLAVPVYAGETKGDAEVRAIYPTSDALPENLLRLYVHFSKPMRRGQAREFIKLIGENGEGIENPFINLAIELWDRDEKRLTLLFDPGRIKRGVGPNVQVGPPLQSGKSYTLVISKGMKDYRGKSLARSFTKSFTVNTPIRSALLPEKWIKHLPKAKSQGPLTLEFLRIMDRPILFRSIRVLDEAGKTVRGEITVLENETGWEFIPSSPWHSGQYRLAVSTDLEDVAGNNVRAAFDVAIDETVMNKKSVEQVFVPFILKD